MRLIKNIVLFIAIITAFNCKKESISEGQWFNAEVVAAATCGCGYAALKIISDTTFAARYLGESSNNIYTSLTLFPSAAIIGTQIKIKARPPHPDEATPCIAMCISYREIVLAEAEKQ